MRQFLWLAGSLAFICLWVAGIALVATGSPRAARQYLWIWMKCIAILLVAGLAIAVVALPIAWPFMG